jgi:hypothetical protein
MSYNPESAAHILELLRQSVEFNDPAMRQHLLDTWLEEIHTPVGTAEHNLCVYVGRLAGWPEQPMDLEHLQGLVRDADLSWASGTASVLGKTKAQLAEERAEIAYLAPLAERDQLRQNGTTKERRPEINEWIRQEIAKRPDATRDELWDAAPHRITDAIGPDRFKTRVSNVRGENK